MRENMLSDSASRILLLVVVLVLVGLVPLSSSSLRSADAAPSTAIAPTPVDAGSLHTIVTFTSAPTNLCSGNCVITGGTRPGGGTNLFHSFGQFNIGSGDITTFQNGISFDVNGTALATGLPTDNILARITGMNGNNPSLSTIYGTIQTAGDFGSANLFLINPAGFLFGPNATVNVGGVITFTTADYIRLTDNGRFNANPTTTPTDLLTAFPVAAFGFIGSNPGAINFEGGQLTVANGTGITLVGGDINFIPDLSGTPSSITAPGRPILLTSVAGEGIVAADTGIPAAGMTLGTITLGQGSILSSAGIDSSFRDGSGGAVSIRGGQFVATGATIITSPAEGGIGVGGMVTVDVTDAAAFTDSFIQTGPVPMSFAGSAGAVSVTANDSLRMTNTFLDASSQQAGGNGGAVTLHTNGSLSLTESFIGTGAYGTSAPGNGGAVTIMGKDVTFNNSGVGTDVDVSSNIIGTPALGQVRPGLVTIMAQDTVTFSGSLSGDPGIPVINATAIGALRDAGSVTVTGKSVNLSNGSIIADMNEGPIPSPGNGGSIEIRGNNVNLSEFTLRSVNAGLPESTGKAGSILIQGADNLHAHSIQLVASHINTSSVSGGGGGPIEFQTKVLKMSEGSVVSTNSFARGAGGTITIRGAENVTVESGSQILTDADGNTNVQDNFGTAGDILVETQNLAVLSGGQIGARARPLSTGNAGNITVQGNNNKPAQSIFIDGTGSGIFSTAEGTGAGGNITLNANTVFLQNGSTLSATTSGTEATATGGSITVKTTDHVLMTNGASITANSTDPGNANAGNILINAGQQFEMRDSSVTAKATQASGGNIDVRAVDRVRLVNSEISSSVQGGASTAGGNIAIDPNVIVLQNSDVTAKAVQGAGGNITLTTPLFLADPSSEVSASSQFGVNGTVTIQSPTSNLSGSLGPLASKPSQAQALLTQRCAALVNGQSSSFVVAGREQLPADPGGWLTSPLAFATLGENLDADNAVASISTVMAIAADNTSTVSLRRLTPAGFLMANFAESAATGCHS